MENIPSEYRKGSTRDQRNRIQLNGAGNYKGSVENRVNTHSYATGVKKKKIDGNIFLFINVNIISINIERSRTCFFFFFFLFILF